MQYFSLIARKGDSKPRTCAMVQAATLEEAARSARRLVNADALPHVEKGSHFSIRSSSRRETSLLQSFLTSKTEDMMMTYRQEDVDSLLYRRSSMLLSFFMALYLDPKKLKDRFDPSSPMRPDTSTGGNGGSGGVTMDASTIVEQDSTSQASQGAAEAHSESSTPEISTEEVAEETVGSDNQISALEDIVNGGSSQESDEIDLF